MKKNCNMKIKYTCEGEKPAMCIKYEGEVNTNSEYTEEGCLSIEETTQDQYNQLEKIWSKIDLSELGESCLEYLTDEDDKIVVKNVLLKFEEKICELEEKVTELQNRPICDMPIGDCIDTSCLVDPCNNNITTWVQLIQILINKNCENI